MRRREFIRIVAGSAASWPLAAPQQTEADAADRRAHEPSHGSQEDQAYLAAFNKPYSNWAGPKAATCRSTTAGPQAMPISFVNTPRNW
jgi:hypothetical protein